MQIAEECKILLALIWSFISLSFFSYNQFFSKEDFQKWATLGSLYINWSAWASMECVSTIPIEIDSIQ